MLTRKDLDRNTENLNDTGEVRIDTTIVCRERKSEYRYHNEQRRHVAKIKVDGGLITGQSQEKCDWLLVNWDDGISFFIELKNSDLYKAISQIKSTINTIWNSIHQLCMTTANVRIIVSRNRYPDYKNAAEYKQLEREIKTRNGNIRLESQKMQENT